jgi:hypothetical protein
LPSSEDAGNFLYCIDLPAFYQQISTVATKTLTRRTEKKIIIKERGRPAGVQLGFEGREVRKLAADPKDSILPGWGQGKG